MKTYNITEKQLFDLLLNSFVAGECFSEEVQDFETGIIEEVTEPDFDEYFKTLNLTDYEKSLEYDNTRFKQQYTN